MENSFSRISEERLNNSWQSLVEGDCWNQTVFSLGLESISFIYDIQAVLENRQQSENNNYCFIVYEQTHLIHCLKMQRLTNEIY